MAGVWFQHAHPRGLQSVRKLKALDKCYLCACRGATLEHLAYDGARATARLLGSELAGAPGAPLPKAEARAQGGGERRDCRSADASRESRRRRGQWKGKFSEPDYLEEGARVLRNPGVRVRTRRSPREGEAVGLWGPAAPTKFGGSCMRLRYTSHSRTSGARRGLRPLSAPSPFLPQAKGSPRIP